MNDDQPFGSTNITHDSVLCRTSHAVMVSTLHVHSPSIKDNAFPSTPLLRIPYLMNAVAPENQPSCGQKRRREHSTTGATSPQPPWKRAKRPFTSREEAEASYWNSLSELCLTRRALKELDRRNRHTASPVTTAIIRRPWRSREPVALKNCSNQIKRFARHGGPDLRNLRGVRLATVIPRLLLTTFP